MLNAMSKLRKVEIIHGNKIIIEIGQLTPALFNKSDERSSFCACWQLLSIDSWILMIKPMS